MTYEMWLVLAVLLTAIVLFVTEWFRVDVIALAVVVTLMLTNTLTTSEALAGFSNSIVLTIASLFIVGGAVLQTGLAGMIGERILRIAGTDEVRLTVVIMLAVAILSGFMSDTGTVAVLLPAVIALAKSAKISPSKLLMPLSFGALLGGAMTLIGTPPNIVVSDLLRESGAEPFGFFSFTPVGILLLLAGVGFMATVGRKLLPDHRTDEEAASYGSHPNDLYDIYLSQDVNTARIGPNSLLHGKTVAQSRLHRDFGVTLLEILRPHPDQPLLAMAGSKIVMKSDKLDSIYPDSSTALHSGDTLVLQGKANIVQKVVEAWELEDSDLNGSVAEQIINEKMGVAEVVLPPRSRLVGRTLEDTKFSSAYNLRVIDIIRPGATEPLDVITTRLQYGDTLFVQGFWDDILKLKRKPYDFILLGEPERAIGAPAKARAPVALLILLGMMVWLVFGESSIAAVSMTASLLMILSGCLTMDQAYKSIDWKSIVLIAGMIPMSTALEKVGLVDLIATGFTSGLGDYGPLVIMTGLFLITTLLTQVISNTATTVIIAPIAMTIAAQFGVRPHAFLMAVAIAASMAFATPVASPVNTLVMGAGEYSFREYLKVGIPMIVVMLIVTIIAVPVVFPF